MTKWHNFSSVSLKSWQKKPHFWICLINIQYDTRLKYFLPHERKTLAKVSNSIEPMFDQVTMDVLMHSATPSKTAPVPLPPDHSSVLKLTQTAISNTCLQLRLTRILIVHLPIIVLSKQRLQTAYLLQEVKVQKLPKKKKKSSKSLHLRNRNQNFYSKQDNYSIIKIVVD